MTTTFVNPRDVHAPVGPYSHTAVVQSGTELVFISGQVGMRADGSVPASFAEQAELTFQNLRACLAAHGLGLDAVVKLGVFVRAGPGLPGAARGPRAALRRASPDVHERLRAAAREPGSSCSRSRRSPPNASKRKRRPATPFDASRLRGRQSLVSLRNVERTVMTRPPYAPASDPRRRIAVRGARGLRAAVPPTTESQAAPTRRRTRSRFSTKSSGEYDTHRRGSRAHQLGQRDVHQLRHGLARREHRRAPHRARRASTRKQATDLRRRRRAGRRAAQARAPEARPHAAGARQTRRREGAR